MKKIAIIALLATGIVLAAPKTSTLSLASCLWHVISGGIANDNETVVVRDDGYVTAAGGFFAQWADGSYIDLEPTYFQITGPTGAGAVFQPNAGAGATPWVFDTEIEHTSGALVSVGNHHTSKFTVYHDGSLVTGDGDRWLLGNVVEDQPATVATNKYVTVQIGGQTVKLAVVE